MRRDLELVRKLLFFFEEKDTCEPVQKPNVPGYNEHTIAYHLLLLHDAGLLRCEPIRSSTSDRVIYVIPFELTWDGHEFLDSIRNPYVWDQVKSEISEKGLFATSFEILKRVTDRALRKRLDLE